MYFGILLHGNKSMYIVWHFKKLLQRQIGNIPGKGFLLLFKMIISYVLCK